MGLAGKKEVLQNGCTGIFLLLTALALALSVPDEQAYAATGGWTSNVTGDWDSVYNFQDNTPFNIDGNGTAIYNNSPTNAYGPANGYTTVAGGESAYWVNFANTGTYGYTASGTDPTNSLGGNFVTTSDNLQLGYFSTSHSGDPNGPGSGTFIMQGGTYSIGSIALSENHQGTSGQSESGFLTVTGGSLVCSTITVGDGLNDGFVANVTVTGGTLNVGSGGVNGAIVPGSAATTNPNTHFAFSGGVVQNISSATVTSFGGGNTCNGSVAGLTGNLTLNCASSGIFTGNVTGSGAGDVVNMTPATITFAPPGGGTMGLVGLTTTANNTTFQFSGSGSSCNQIAIGSSGLSIGSGHVIGVNLTNVTQLSSGTYGLVSGVGSTPLSAFSISGSSGSETFAVAGGSLDLVVPSSNVNGIWSGNGGNNHWETTGNWAGGTAPGIGATTNDTATFNTTSSNTGSITVALDSQTPNLAAINFSGTDRSYTLGAPGDTGAFTLQNSAGTAALNVTSGTHAIAVPITLASPLAIGVSGSLALKGIVTGGTNSLAENGSGALEIDGALTVPVFNIHGSSTLTGSGTITMSSSSDGIYYGSSSASSFSGTLTGAGALEVDSGTLALSGSDNYTGGTTVAAGLLLVESSGGLPGGLSLTVGDHAFPAPIVGGQDAAILSGLAPVPEPGTLALLAAGIGAVVVYRRRR